MFYMLVFVKVCDLLSFKNILTHSKKILQRLSFFRVSKLFFRLSKHFRVSKTQWITSIVIFAI